MSIILTASYLEGLPMVSFDNGNHWKTLNTLPLDCVRFYSSSIGWAGSIDVGTLSPTMHQWIGGPLIFNKNLVNVKTIIGSGVEGLRNGDKATAQFANPKGMAMDKAGNLYIADDYNHVIRKVTPTGEVSTFAGNGAAGYVNGDATTAQFSRPQDVVVDASGNVYVADATNFVIRKITPNGEVSLFAGQAGVEGEDDGSLMEATFGWLPSLGIDGAGNLYATDIYGKTRKIDIETGTVSTIYEGSFSWGMDADFAGNVYIAQVGNIIKVSPDGTVTILAGNFTDPDDVTVDNLGNVYVIEGIKSTIKHIDPHGNVTTVAGMPIPFAIYGGDNGWIDGAGQEAVFGRLRGILLKPDGNLLVNSWDNNTIREIQLGRKSFPVRVLSAHHSSKYPTTNFRQLEAIQFSSVVHNSNEEQAYELSWTVEVLLEGESLFEDFLTFNFEAGELEVLSLENGFLPQIAGDYDVRFYYEVAGEEPWRQTIYQTFSVSDSLLAIDDGRGYFRLSNALQGANMAAAAFGHEFELAKADTLTSFTGNIFVNQANIYFTVYEMTETGPGELIYSSDTLYNYNSSFPFYHHLSQPLGLEVGTYLFTLEKLEGDGIIRVALDSDAQNDDSWLKAADLSANDWTRMAEWWAFTSKGPSFMIRPSFNSALMTSIKEIETVDIALQITPNPTIDVCHISIQSPLNKVFQVKVFDMAGQEMAAFELWKEQAKSLDIKDWSSGTYVVKAFQNDSFTSKKLIKP